MERIQMNNAAMTYKEECEALRAEVESLTRQRDLAVSAIENLVKQKGRHNTEIAYKKLVEALADIKEGEG